MFKFLGIAGIIAGCSPFNVTPPDQLDRFGVTEAECDDMGGDYDPLSDVGPICFDIDY